MSYQTLDSNKKVRNYKSIANPTFAKYNHQELAKPLGILVDKRTDTIYICDNKRNAIKVYSSDGNILYSFPASDPTRLCISQHMICVTSSIENAISFYTEDGYLITKIDSGIALYSRLNGPMGIGVDDENSIYICNCIANEILMLSNENPTLNFLIGRIYLSYPRDIKVTTDSLIVLDGISPCISFYSLRGFYIDRFITQGFEQHRWRPFTFELDSKQNILLSDQAGQSIRIFTKGGELIRTINTDDDYNPLFSNPTGMALNSKMEIIIVDNSRNERLKIF